MLAFVLRRGSIVSVSPDYDLGVRMSDERVELGEFTWLGRRAGVSCTEFLNALLVHISHWRRGFSRPEVREMHCRVLDSTGRPLHSIGLHPAFYRSHSAGPGMSTDFGLVFSKRGKELARARVIVTTDEGEFEMMYQPVRRTPNPTDRTDAAGDPNGRGER